MEELGVLLAQSEDGQQVNSVFGEGVNPRLRKIRDGLNELGLPADELLRHGAPRLAYGLALVENLEAYLLGIDRRPRYVLSQREGRAVTQGIIEDWRERWVERRIAREEVLGRMAAERLVHPIRHGARVVLPREISEQRWLFEE